VSRERMLREGQVLARLSHPNVIPIFDVGEVGDQVFLIMEWIKGETLRAFRPASAQALLDVYRQAGEGLAAAHRAGVIHRDFKPDNAIRGDDGRVRVLDFGLARAAMVPARLGSSMSGSSIIAPVFSANTCIACANSEYSISLSAPLRLASCTPACNSL